MKDFLKDIFNEETVALLYVFGVPFVAWLCGIGLTMEA